MSFEFNVFGEYEQQHEAIAVNFNDLNEEQNRADLMCIFVCLVGCFFSTLFRSVYCFFGGVEFYSSIIIIWIAQNEESFVLSDVIFDINRICSLTNDCAQIANALG